MPLSEHEQRLLDEMERNLYRHDADFVASVSGRRVLNSRNIVIGAIAALLGLGLIISALVGHIVLLGIAGFAVLLAGVVLAMRTSPAEPSAGGASKASKPTKTKRGFMGTINDRWDRRTG